MGEVAAPPPTAAELLQAARAVLLGRELPMPVLPPRALTFGLCADLQHAVELALQSQEVMAGLQGKATRRDRSLGLVAAALLGHAQAELQEPEALEAAGKKLAVVARAQVSKKASMRKKEKAAKSNLRQRHKGAAAELQEQLAALERTVAEEAAACCGRPAPWPFDGKGRAVSPPATSSALALVEGPRVTASIQDAAASLATMAAPAAIAPAAAVEAPRQLHWSCPRCSELLKEKAEAREAAAAAEQAKHIAEHLRSAAYLDVQLARQQLRERVEALEVEQARALQERSAAHVLALEQRDAAHAEALLVAREEAKRLDALAEERRKEVVKVKQHQSTLSLNAFQEGEELRKLKKKTSTAGEQLKKLKEKHEDELSKLRNEQGRLQRELQMAAESCGLLSVQAEQLRSELRAEQTRRGMAEKALARQQQQRAARGAPEEEESHCTSYGRLAVNKLTTSVAQLKKKLSEQDAQAREAEAAAAAAHLQIAIMGGELRRDERAMGIKEPNFFEARKASASPNNSTPSPLPAAPLRPPRPHRAPMASLRPPRALPGQVGAMGQP